MSLALIRKTRRASTVRRKAPAKSKRKPRVSGRSYVPRGVRGFADSCRTTLRYSERQELKPTDLECVAWSYGVNDLFDPLQNVGGHQPRGFDNYSNIYKTYTVVNARIMVNFLFEGYLGITNDEAGLPGPAQQIDGDPTSDVPAASAAIVGIFKSVEAAGTMPNVDLQMERSGTKWAMLTPDGGGSTVTHRTNMTDLFGKRSPVASEGYSGNTGSLTGSRPAKIAYFHVFAGRGSTRSTGNCKISAFTTIDYDVVFTEKLPLDAS